MSPYHLPKSPTGTGSFAESVFKWHGDRVIVITGQLWAAENDAKYSRQFPQVRTASFTS